MKIEKPTENWTKFPNCILDNLQNFNGSELLILALMVRKNIGYDNPNKKFSISYIALKTGLSESNVKTSVKNLLKKKSIYLTGRGERGIHIYDINWSISTKPKIDPVKNCHSTKPKFDPVPSQNLTTLQENKLQENKLQENIRDGLPSQVDKLLNFWQKTFSEPIILSAKNKKQVQGIIDLQKYDRLESAIKQAKIEQDNKNIAYTFKSIIYSPSNIASLSGRYKNNDDGVPESVREKLRELQKKRVEL